MEYVFFPLNFIVFVGKIMLFHVHLSTTILNSLFGVFNISKLTKEYYTQNICLKFCFICGADKYSSLFPK